MCYTKLANCFGRGTAIGGIHVTRNIAATLCLRHSEVDGACLPPVGWGCPIALPDITLCKFWEWLAVIFRIQRSSPIISKPLTRSHCKAMCYRKLANCFGRVTAGVDIHAASNVLAMVLPLCLQRSEGAGTCLLPVG